MTLGMGFQSQVVTLVWGLLYLHIPNPPFSLDRQFSRAPDIQDQVPKKISWVLWRWSVVIVERSFPGPTLISTDCAQFNFMGLNCSFSMLTFLALLYSKASMEVGEDITDLRDLRPDTEWPRLSSYTPFGFPWGYPYLEVLRWLSRDAETAMRQ